MINVLLFAGRSNLNGAQRGLADYLTATGNVCIEITDEPERLRRLDSWQVVLVAGLSQLLTSEQEGALNTFVQKGGGLITLGEVGEIWQESRMLRELTGASGGYRSPVTELIAHTASEDVGLTRRLDPAFSVIDSFYLMEKTPEQAQVVLQTNWHFAPYALAYCRTVGRGRVFYTSLGNSVAALAQPNFQQVIFRAVNYAAGVEETKPIGVAMIGYGAIGFEHGEAISHVPGLEYRAVCDRNPARLKEAERVFPGIKTFDDLAEVAADPEIGLVIVSTPPNTHAAVALQMLEVGKHVVVEKPFCLEVAEADSMIALAREKGLTLTVYQNRRWDADFLAIRAAIEAGAIGEVFHLETFIGGFSHPCDYWHSHEPVSGGVFYDWGSHYLDWVLNLMPQAVTQVRASSHKRVWHDVTNSDQARVQIRFAGGQEAEFIHSDIAAALKPKWYILGTQGAIVGHWREESVKTRRWSGDLIEEHLAPSEALPTLYLHRRDPNGMIHEERLSLPPAPRYPFHRNLADHLLSGERLTVLPTSSRRNIAVMEAAKYSAAHDSEVMHLDC